MGINALQAFNAANSFPRMQAAMMAVMCNSQLSHRIVLRLQLPAKAGLVQIANALMDGG
jgi:hypothetical protein